MKIYFENGPLHNYNGTLPFDRNYYVVSSDEGVQQNLGLLDYLKHFCSIDVTVYTNSILGLFYRQMNHMYSLHSNSQLLLTNFQLALYTHIYKSHPSTQNNSVYAAWSGWCV